LALENANLSKELTGSESGKGLLALVAGGEDADAAPLDQVDAVRRVSFVEEFLTAFHSDHFHDGQKILTFLLSEGFEKRDLPETRHGHSLRLFEFPGFSGFPINVRYCRGLREGEYEVVEGIREK
jgi:hypothetical protein